MNEVAKSNNWESGFKQKTLLINSIIRKCELIKWLWSKDDLFWYDQLIQRINQHYWYAFHTTAPCRVLILGVPTQRRNIDKWRILLSGVSENEVKRTLNTDGIFAYLAVVSVSLSALYSTAAVVTPAASSTKHSIQDITKTCLYSHSQFRIIPLCEFYQKPF